MKELMYDINAGLISVVLLAIVIAMVEAGYRLGRRTPGAAADDDSKAHINATQSSTLGILALLLAFTFSLSLPIVVGEILQHDTRKNELVLLHIRDIDELARRPQPFGRMIAERDPHLIRPRFSHRQEEVVDESVSHELVVDLFLDGQRLRLRFLIDGDAILAERDGNDIEDDFLAPVGLIPELQVLSPHVDQRSHDAALR